jgi:hypothetical protein
MDFGETVRGGLSFSLNYDVRFWPKGELSDLVEL